MHAEFQNCPFCDRMPSVATLNQRNTLELTHYCSLIAFEKTFVDDNLSSLVLAWDTLIIESTHNLLDLLAAQ